MRRHFLTFAAAATACVARGDTLLLDYCRRWGCPFNAFVSCAAARAGCLPALQWIHQHYGSALLSGSACSEAAARGHLHVLAWLRQHGAAWDVHTARQAAAHDQLEVLQWTQRQEPPCPMDDGVVQALRGRGHGGLADAFQARLEAARAPAAAVL
jgi:hypothetical protein